jgi:hypothetical protein
MSLPRGDEYNLAIQNPDFSFFDPVLKTGKVETTPLGLPKPYSGGFTITYRLNNRNQSWAVRCFTREVKDLQERYEAIGKFLKSSTCSSFVQATCLQKGILIRNVHYPIIKMEWVNGDPLNIYIRNNLNNSTLVNIKNEFFSLVQSLETKGIAHGDLQHGNIIVKDHKLFLVDYDGVFLPEISKLVPDEYGHQNYQHPTRKNTDYSRNMDRFSAIVIYLALTALSIKPNLWEKYDNSENILFKYLDYVKPETSNLINELKQLPEISKLIDKFRDVLKLNFNQVPSLNEFILGKIITPEIMVDVRKISFRSPYPIFNASEKGSLLEHIGERVEIIGLITSLHKDKSRHGQPYLFLNFGQYPHQSFTLVLWSTIIKEFEKLGKDPSNYIEKWVSVTGVVNTYKNKPQIIIDMPSQIQPFNEEEEAKERLKSYQRGHTEIASPKAVEDRREDRLKKISTGINNSQKPDMTKYEAETYEKLYGNKTPVSNPTSIAQSRKPYKVDIFKENDVQTLNNLYGKAIQKSSSPTTKKNRSNKKSYEKGLIIISIIALGLLIIICLLGGLASRTNSYHLSTATPFKANTSTLKPAITRFPTATVLPSDTPIPTSTALSYYHTEVWEIIPMSSAIFIASDIYSNADWDIWIAEQATILAIPEPYYWEYYSLSTGVQYSEVREFYFSQITQKGYKIALEQEENGVYLITFYDGSSKIAIKFIKQNSQNLPCIMVIYYNP